MTSAQSILLHPPQPSAALCAILSVAVHVGIFAGLGVISHTSFEAESVPVIQISLVTGKTEKPSLSSAPTPPTLHASTRSITSPPSLSTPSTQLKVVHLKAFSSPLQPPKPQESHENVFDSPKKRVFKDDQAANALIGQSLMKMVNTRNTQSQPSVQPQLSPQKLASEALGALPSGLETEVSNASETQTTSSFPTQRRLLTARPPGGQFSSESKVGILRFVKPVYPPIAKDAGWEGTVIVRVLVDTNGVPGGHHYSEKQRASHPGSGRKGSGPAMAFQPAERWEYSHKENCCDSTEIRTP